MLRRPTAALLLVIVVSACGGSDADGGASDGGAGAEAEASEFGLLAIAAFEWGDDPEPGHTTPFSFEIIAPASNGSMDLSYWLEIHVDHDLVATSPRFDVGADTEGDLGAVAIRHGLPVPWEAAGEVELVVHVLENSTGAHVAHTEMLVFP